MTTAIKQPSESQVEHPATYEASNRLLLTVIEEAEVYLGLARPRSEPLGQIIGWFSGDRRRLEGQMDPGTHILEVSHEALPDDVFSTSYARGAHMVIRKSLGGPYLITPSIINRELAA